MITRQLTRTRRRSITRPTKTSNRFTITRRADNGTRLFRSLTNQRITNRSGLTNHTRQATRTTTSLTKSTWHNTIQMARRCKFSIETVRGTPRHLSNNTLVNRLVNRLISREQRRHLSSVTTYNNERINRHLKLNLRPTRMVIHRLLSARLQRSRVLHPNSTLIEHRVRRVRQQLTPSNVILKRRITRDPLITKNSSNLQLFHVLHVPNHRYSSVVIHVLSSFPTSSYPVIGAAIAYQRSATIQPKATHA